MNHPRNVRGAMQGGIVGLVVGLVVVAVGLIVGLLVIGALNVYSSTVNYGSSVANTTASTLFTNINTALNLLVIVPIIMAAGAIIAVVGGILYMRSR